MTQNKGSLGTPRHSWEDNVR